MTEITNEMKAKFIGEFFWYETEFYKDEDGELVEHQVRRTVPWFLFKEIYTRMREFSATHKGEE